MRSFDPNLPDPKGATRRPASRSVGDGTKRRRPAKGTAAGPASGAMRVVKWGRRVSGNLLAEYDPASFPSIARVCEHLGLYVVEVRGEGEPSQVALGAREQGGDPDAAEIRSTPFFSTLAALDFFCQRNLQTYLAIDRSAALPRRWFWQQSSARSGPSGFGASLSEVSVRVGSDR